MRTLEPNPIVRFVTELLQSGKITKEKICVAADLKYPTFDNMFERELVSPLVRKGLHYSGVVPPKIFDEYNVWFETVFKPKRKNAKAPKSRPS